MKHFFLFVCAACLAFSAFLQPAASVAQTAPASSIGEKLTYNISFAAFSDAGFLELHNLGREKLNDREVSVVRARLRTSGTVQATLLNIDHESTVFIEPNTNLPIRAERFLRTDDKPVEVRRDFSENQIASDANLHDLISALYQIRTFDFNNNQIQTLKIWENDRVVEIRLQAAKRETISTAIGAFNAFVVQVRSADEQVNRFKTKIYLSDDDRRVPVLISLRLPQGEVRAELASLQNILPEPVIVEPPVATATPIVQPTARPIPPAPTPKPYVDNQPLSAELPFALKEKLQFEVLRGREKIGVLNFEIVERKFLNSRDTVRLTATVQPAGGANIFTATDKIESLIDPNYLVPFRHELKLGGALAGYNQILTFDQERGAVTNGQNGRAEAPVGTHDVLSFVYALRAFRFNVLVKGTQDTRAAVFLNGAPVVVTLRPASEVIELNGKKINALAIAAATGNPQIDSLGLRLWLSDDARRLPLKFTANTPQGVITANLINF